MNEEQLTATLQACYWGDKGAYNKMLKEYKELQEENEKLKEKIKTLTKKNASKKIYGEYKNVRLSEKEYNLLVECYGQELTTQLITYLDEYIEMKGYKAKSHYLCMKRWVIDAVKNNRYKNTRQPIRIEKEPEWLNKEIKPEMASPEEIAELKEMLKDYK